jgi:hypothetical protein
MKKEFIIDTYLLRMTEFGFNGMSDNSYNLADLTSANALIHRAERPLQ